MKNRKSMKKRRRRSGASLRNIGQDNDDDVDNYNDRQKEQHGVSIGVTDNAETALGGGDADERLRKCSKRSYVDMMVMNPDPPKKKPNVSVATGSPLSLRRRLAVEELLDRLESTGYTTVAMAHTIYGAPRPEQDRVDRVFDGIDLGRKKLTVLRRLHAVVENLSDVGLYAASAPKDIQNVLNEYDLISICPRNDDAFQAACVSATGADTITLDYAISGRGGAYLPYKIRAADAKVAVQRGVIFEIPYAPAVVNRSQRKGFIQTCRELQTACLGMKPKVLLSSGRRFDVSASEDIGPMALRVPGDLINLCKVVAGFDDRTATAALRANGYEAVDHAHKRRFGSTLVAGACVVVDPESIHRPADQSNAGKEGFKGRKVEERTNDKGKAGNLAVVEDGFISF